MKSEDIKNLIDYIMEKNSWETCSLINGRKMPKYVDFRLDTRDGIIFSICFDQHGKQKPEASFVVENEDDLKLVYEWLDAPILMGEKEYKIKEKEIMDKYIGKEIFYDNEYVPIVDVKVDRGIMRDHMNRAVDYYGNIWFLDEVDKMLKENKNGK